MTADVSDAFVFFGASGDLAYKQIFPALLALIKDGRLDMPIIGVAKSDWDLEKLKERARDSIEKFGKMDDDAFARLMSLLQYIDGDYKESQTFEKLKNLLGQAKSPLYYLAVPPDTFETVAAGLKHAGCVKNARVVVEKPFGHDLESAKELQEKLHKYFPEKNIFRVDHFLGKEPVQNIVYFRFANPLIETAWNHHLIDSVEITMAEKFGVEGRGKLYDAEGAIRDVVQNHMLQVIACLAMECPEGNDHYAMRKERARVLKAIRPLTKDDVVRGQFKGYKKEEGVAPDSEVETYAALKFMVDNKRWKDVPFYVRVGKCMPVTANEAIVKFKNQFPEELNNHFEPQNDYVRFRLSPDQCIDIGLQTKEPGEQMIGKLTDLVAHQNSKAQMPPYERLLGDAIVGDALLFAREDEVEAAWKILDPVLQAETELHIYEPGSWGPENQKVQPQGGWHNPPGSDTHPAENSSANNKTSESQGIQAGIKQIDSKSKNIPEKILAIDVGGTNVKILLNGEKESRKTPSGPDMTAAEMVEAVKKMAQGWKYDAISIGYPGPVLHGKPLSEPYELGRGWVGFDFEKAFGCPVKLINDAAMQAIGSYQGGKMLFIGLGTGLGSTMIAAEQIEPMEIGHLPYKKQTYEDFLGKRGLKRLGKKEWRQAVNNIVALLFKALEPDYIVIGGGDAKKLKDLPPNCRMGDNANAFTGGFRLWQKPLA